jgi:hypothetical protein
LVNLDSCIDVKVQNGEKNGDKTARGSAGDEIEIEEGID